MWSLTTLVLSHGAERLIIIKCSSRRRPLERVQGGGAVFFFLVSPH